MDKKVPSFSDFFPDGIHEDLTPLDGEIAYTKWMYEMRQEREAYDKEKLDLLRRAGGQWTVFVCQKCLGMFETQEDAAEVGYREAAAKGRRAVFVIQIGMEYPLSK